MRGFSGFCDLQNDLHEEWYLWRKLCKDMTERLYGAADGKVGVHVAGQTALGFTYRFSDPDYTDSVYTWREQCEEYTALFYGELYNAPELRAMLKGKAGNTESDSALILHLYLQEGEAFLQRLNGVFALVIDDPVKKQVLFARDPFGVKSLFFTRKGGCFAFSTELKALFAYPGIRPIVTKTGLQEIFGIGPAHTAGAEVFRDIEELLPGQYGILRPEGFTQQPYFALTPRTHTDDYIETVLHVRDLLTDIVARQTRTPHPYCSLLSGGLDSSIITAIAQKQLGNTPLSTFSFEMEGNREYYQPNVFQPGADTPFALLASEKLGTAHRILSCDSFHQAELLYPTVAVKDMPCMADVDSSFLYFCTQIREDFPIALCGECADEIFGGYPWCHRQVWAQGFPWSGNFALRESLLSPALRRELQLAEYAGQRYREMVAAAPQFDEDDEENARQRLLFYCNLYGFGATLITRKERAAMGSGLSIRMPFADPELVQYVYNIPWAFKKNGGVAKTVLRDAAAGLLPEEVRLRKKSPYPKTYSPSYEELVKKELKAVLQDSSQPLCALLSGEAITGLLNESFDYASPWYGQLMAGPQLLAYLLQINDWLSRFHAEIEGL